MINDYTEYSDLSYSEKDFFWTEDVQYWIKNKSTEDIYRFFCLVMQHDIPYMRYQASKAVALALFSFKLKPRQVQGLYLDRFPNEDDAFVEIIRLRTLNLFYAENQKEIFDYIKARTESLQADIASEAYIQLGISYLYNSFCPTKQAMDTSFFQGARRCFAEAYSLVENRLDALLLFSVSNVILSILNNGNSLNENIMDMICKQNNYCAYHISIKQIPWFVVLSNKIIEIHNSFCDAPDEWINFRDSLNTLGLITSAICTSRFTDDYLPKNLDIGNGHLLLEHWFKPTWSNLLIGEQKRIRKLKNTLSPEDPSWIFLNELETIKGNGSVSDSLIFSLNRKGISLSEAQIKELDSAFPAINDEDKAKIIQLSHYKSDDTILEDIIICCALLQGNYLYFSALENDRNTYLRDLLDCRGYNAYDQHLQGLSAGKKQSGELDLVLLWNGEKRTIVEALNLTYLDKQYIELHANKLFSYDTQGLPRLILISYVNIVDFDKFYASYYAYASKLPYIYKLASSPKEIVVKHSGTDLRVICTEHDRNGKKISIYHILVLFPTILKRDQPST